jgi:hypothetical protein
MVAHTIWHVMQADARHIWKKVIASKEGKNNQVLQHALKRRFTLSFWRLMAQRYAAAVPVYGLGTTMAYSTFSRLGEDGVIIFQGSSLISLY